MSLPILLGMLVFVLVLVMLVRFVARFLPPITTETERLQALRTQKFAGLVTMALGAILFLGWSYFMTLNREALIQAESFFTGRERETESFFLFGAHGFLEFFSSVALMFSAFGLLFHWFRAPAVFLVAMALLTLTVLLSIYVYGLKSPVLWMDGLVLFALVLTVLGIGAKSGWGFLASGVETLGESTRRSTRRDLGKAA